MTPVTQMPGWQDMVRNMQGAIVGTTGYTGTWTGDNLPLKNAGVTWSANVDGKLLQRRAVVY